MFIPFRAGITRAITDMEKYLQIPLALVLALSAGMGWNMVPKKTVYKYLDGADIYVVEGRWVDSMGLSELPTGQINRSLPPTRVKVVALDSNDIVK